MKKRFNPLALRTLVVITALLGSTGLPLAHAGGRTPDQSELSNISLDFSIGFEARLLSFAGRENVDQSFFFHVNEPGDIVGSLRFTDTPAARFQTFRLALEDEFMTPPNEGGASFLIDPTHPVSPDGRSVTFKLAGARVGDYRILVETWLPLNASATLSGTLGLSAVPEPSTLGMLAIGLVGVAGVSARSRRQG